MNAQTSVRIDLRNLKSKVPPKLLKYSNWVAFYLETRPDGKTDKIPTDPHTGGNASSTDPQTWGTFNQAVERAIRDNLPGVGFVFTDTPICGIDLDHCRSPQTGEIESWAWVYIRMLDTYTEVSPSGTGIHCLTLGNLPPCGRKREKVEMYDTGRFFTFTGQHLEGTPTTVEKRTEALAILHRLVFGEEKPKPTPARRPASSPLPDDQKLLARIRESKQAAKFEQLWSGDTSGYPSPSEADFALCGMLAFWTGGDEAQMDRLFRRSGLYREKWDVRHYNDDRTYGQGTIFKVLEGQIEFYTPGGNGQRNGVTAIETETMDREAARAKPQTFHRTDAGNAELLVHLFGDQLRYDHNRGKWLIWKGHRWLIDETGEVYSYALKTARHWLKLAAETEDDDKRQAMARHSFASESRARLTNMLELAAKKKPIARTIDEFDADPWLLGVANGVVNLRTGELRPGRPDDHITMSTEIGYDPGATCPRWIKFLEEVYGDNQHLVKFTRKMIGYSLTGDTSEQCFPILYGLGANGKTTKLNILKSALGDYAADTPFSTFEYNDSRWGNRPSNDVAALKGKRLVTAREGSYAVRLNEGRIKAMTGGDPVTCRFLHQEFFTYQPTYKIWLATNEKPIIRGTTRGTWRRIRLVPFEVTFEDNADKDLERKLRAELPGILAWAVRGCLDWQKEGLPFPDEVKDATEEYRRESDPVSQFLAEGPVITGDTTYQVPATELYQVYRQWSEQHGEKVESQTRFGRRLGELGYNKTRLSTGPRPTAYLGIGLLSKSDTVDTVDTVDTTNDQDEKQSGINTGEPCQPCQLCRDQGEESLLAQLQAEKAHLRDQRLIAKEAGDEKKRQETSNELVALDVRIAKEKDRLSALEHNGTLEQNGTPNSESSSYFPTRENLYENGVPKCSNVPKTGSLIQLQVEIEEGEARYQWLLANETKDNRDERQWLRIELDKKRAKLEDMKDADKLLFDV